MKKYTIKDLSEGKVAVHNNGTLEQLTEVLKLAFPENGNPYGGCDYYYKHRESSGWYAKDTTSLPIQSVTDFLNQEKTYPRVMLVSQYNGINTGHKRVVLMEKRGKYIAWVNAETLEEAEKRCYANPWNYAWELEEQSIFPFQLQPQDAQTIIDAVCQTWKEKLSNSWASSIGLKKSIEISEEYYNKMYKACTAEQKVLFKTIFK